MGLYPMIGCNFGQYRTVTPWHGRAERALSKSQGNLLIVVYDSPQPVSDQRPGEIIYHGNRNSKVFHHPSCKDYNCKNCVIRFGSRRVVIAKGLIDEMGFAVGDKFAVRKTKSGISLKKIA